MSVKIEIDFRRRQDCVIRVLLLNQYGGVPSYISRDVSARNANILNETRMSPWSSKRLKQSIRKYIWFVVCVDMSPPPTTYPPTYPLTLIPTNESPPNLPSWPISPTLRGIQIHQSISTNFKTCLCVIINIIISLSHHCPLFEGHKAMRISDCHNWLKHILAVQSAEFAT